MPIQQVSFQNTPIAKQNLQQNIAVSPITTNSVGDTVEISAKKKENKTLKYALIGVGALATVILVVNHKKIRGIFDKNINIPINKPEKTISYKEHIENLIRNKDKVSSDPINGLIRRARKGDIEALQDVRISRDIELIKRNSKFDYWENPQLYRFVGQSEVDALIKENKHILSYNYGGKLVDTTLDPNYNFAGAKYRVKFKLKDKFDPAIHTEGIQWNNDIPFTYLKNESLGQCETIGGYCLNDVEAIHSKDLNGEWTKLIYQSKTT